MLHSSIGIGVGYLLVPGIASGQYYWILGALFGIVLTLLLMSYIFTDAKN